MRDHRLARGIERGVGRHPVRLADAMNAYAIRGRRMARLELRAELARDHATRLIDLHNPRAAKKLEVFIEYSLGNVGPEPESPRVRVVRQRFAHETQVLAECVSLDELPALTLGAYTTCEDSEVAVVRPTVGREPNLLHRSPE